MVLAANEWSAIREIPGADWILGIAGLAIGITIAYYFVKLFRDMAVDDPGGIVGNHLSEFRKLRDEGKIQRDEFDQLKDSISTDKKEAKEADSKLQTKQQNSATEDKPQLREVDFTEVEEDN